MTSELVQQDGDPVDASACLEVVLYLLRTRAIVDVADEDAARVDGLFALVRRGKSVAVDLSLHFAQFGSFGFHVFKTLLHGRDFLLRARQYPASICPCSATHIILVIVIGWCLGIWHLLVMGRGVGHVD